MKLALLLLLAGSLASAARVDQMSLGSAAADDVCELSSPAVSFPATTNQIVLRFVLSSVRTSDQVIVEWLDPAGRVASSAPYEQLPPARSLCLLSQLSVGGFAPSRFPGRWVVRIAQNGVELASRPFEITAVPGAATFYIARVIPEQKGPSETELIVEGEGFNPESIVHVAQYTKSGGWNYILHSFPEKLQPNRLTVRIGALIPAEYVVFVKNAETLSLPGRFVIATSVGYRLPVLASEGWTISQTPYGQYSHWGRTLHAFDIAPRGGSLVRAMRAGVAHAFDFGFGQTPNRRIFGNYITIDHGDGEYSHYAHLRARTFHVRTGDRVEAGQPLATVGNSGFSFGAHLHVQVTRSFKIASQSIPFRFEDASGQRGPIRPVAPDPSKGTVILTRSSAPSAPEPAWTASVPVAGWWSELTAVPQGARELEIRLGWDAADRDLDLHLVSPAGHHYGPFASVSGFTASATEKTFRIPNPEPGTWRVSVQGIRGTGEAIPFKVFRSMNTSSGWGGSRRD